MTSSQKLINMNIATLIEQTRAKDANPGGGSLLILISNLAINLTLMMDKNDWDKYGAKASVSRETLLKLSNQLKNLMQDDVDNFKSLMRDLKNKEVNEDSYKRAADPLIKMVASNIEALEVLNFYLEHGKRSTLSDGQIANDLLKTTTLASIPTIRLNMDMTEGTIDYENIESKTKALYEANKLAIERRIK